MSTLAAFSRVIADATSQLGEPAFAEVLGLGICQLVGADDVSVIRHRDTGTPLIEYTLPTQGRGETTLDRYVKGPFLLDPFYRASELEDRYGVFRLSTLAPKGFKESEYYRTWYHACGFKDECGMLIKLSHGSVNIALGITDTSRKFLKAQVKQLEDMFPAAQALMQRHWSAPDPAIVDPSDFRHRLQHAQKAFGSSILTPREREVIELVLLGHSTRLIAEKLGISGETVKLHRKHAYHKLDISSQAELFYLFVDALANHTGGAQHDPLLAYHGLATAGHDQ